MSWSSVLPAAATIGSSLIGASSAQKAADAQASAADKAAQMQWDMYATNREDLRPYREAGVQGLNALGALMSNPSSIAATPGYDFRMSEGTKAIDRSAAAKGLLNSGATAKALTRFGQDYASNEYGQQWNRLAALAGIGQTSTGNTVSAGQATANSVGNSYLAGGQARGSGYTGTANAVNNGVNNLLYLYGKS